MALQIKWTKRSEERFFLIVEYIELEWGRKIASDFVDSTDDVIDLLSLFPEIGNLENQQKKYSRFFDFKTNKIILQN